MTMLIAVEHKRSGAPRQACRGPGTREVSLHASGLKENPVQAWFDSTGQFIVLETPGQRAQVWGAATGLPVTPIFESRYASSEEEYRTVKLPTFPKSQIGNAKWQPPRRHRRLETAGVE